MSSDVTRPASFAVPVFCVAEGSRIWLVGDRWWRRRGRRQAGTAPPATGHEHSANPSVNKPRRPVMDGSLEFPGSIYTPSDARYSARSVVAGSSLRIRSAGTRLASAGEPTKKAATATKVTRIGRAHAPDEAPEQRDGRAARRASRVRCRSPPGRGRASRACGSRGPRWRRARCGSRARGFAP